MNNEKFFNNSHFAASRLGDLEVQLESLERRIMKSFLTTRTSQQVVSSDSSCYDRRECDLNHVNVQLFESLNDEKKEKVMHKSFNHNSHCVASRV